MKPRCRLKLHQMAKVLVTRYGISWKDAITNAKLDAAIGPDMYGEKFSWDTPEDYEVFLLAMEVLGEENQNGNTKTRG